MSGDSGDRAGHSIRARSRGIPERARTHVVRARVDDGVDLARGPSEAQGLRYRSASHRSRREQRTRTTTPGAAGHAVPLLRLVRDGVTERVRIDSVQGYLVVPRMLPAVRGVQGTLVRRAHGLS